MADLEKICTRTEGVRLELTTELPGGLKFKTRIFYHEINGSISSRLDVMVVTDTRERIIENFGNFGPTVDEAINKNFETSL